MVNEPNVAQRQTHEFLTSEQVLDHLGLILGYGKSNLAETTN